MRKKRDLCQAAAVCYRRKGRAVEFLLVQTGCAKWTFPKGNIEPGLGARRSAEREALEEAGVEGSIAERPFHTYLASKGVFWKEEGVEEYRVQAYLLDVKRTCMPAESFRNPTWRSPAAAKELLSHQREQKYAHELAEVVDEAVRLLTPPGRNGGHDDFAQALGLAYS